MQIQLMSDGGADIPNHLMEALNIKVVPLYLYFQSGEYKTGETMDQETFYQEMSKSDGLPRSSAPGPMDFYDAYKQINSNIPIIILSISGGLSVTYENAVIAKNMLLEEETDRQIEVINSKTASCGLTLLLHEAKKKIDENCTYSQIIDHLYRQVEQTNTLFVLKTLENLILGGRLSRVKGTIAKSLNIKPLMRGSDEGTIEVIEKVRGDKKSIRRFVEQIGEYTTNFEDKIITMAHCNAEDQAQKVLANIREKYPFKDAFLMNMGPLIATYAGEGGIVMSFFNN